MFLVFGCGPTLALCQANIILAASISSKGGPSKLKRYIGYSMYLCRPTARTMHADTYLSVVHLIHTEVVCSKLLNLRNSLSNNDDVAKSHIKENTTFVIPTMARIYIYIYIRAHTIFSLLLNSIMSSNRYFTGYGVYYFDNLIILP